MQHAATIFIVLFFCLLYAELKDELLTSGLVVLEQMFRDVIQFHKSFAGLRLIICGLDCCK